MNQLRKSFKNAIQTLEDAIGRKHKKKSYFVKTTTKGGIKITVADIYEDNVYVVKFTAYVMDKKVYINGELISGEDTKYE